MEPKTFKLIPGWLPPEFDASGGGRVNLGVGVDIKADGSGGSPAASVMAMTLSAEGSPQVPNQQLEVLLTLRFWGPDVPNQRLALTATSGARRLAVADTRYGFEEEMLGSRVAVIRKAGERWTAAWNEDDVHCSVDSSGVTRDELLRFIAELVRVEPETGPAA